jgi:hypothetical protein
MSFTDGDLYESQLQEAALSAECALAELAKDNASVASVLAKPSLRTEAMCRLLLKPNR